jgi:hypothetical protein
MFVISIEQGQARALCEREIFYVIQSVNCKSYKISPRTSFEMTTFLFLPNTCDYSRATAEDLDLFF